jgi:hypothetical protein
LTCWTTSKKENEVKQIKNEQAEDRSIGP